MSDFKWHLMADEVKALERENAKLRELVRDHWHVEQVHTYVNREGKP